MRWRKQRAALLKDSGPYRVVSHSQTGDGTVYLVVSPAFPEYGDGWMRSRANGEGGGPGIFTAIALARSLEEWLNMPYSRETVVKWHKRLARWCRIGKRYPTVKPAMVDEACERVL